MYVHNIWSFIAWERVTRLNCCEYTTLPYFAVLSTVYTPIVIARVGKYIDIRSLLYVYSSHFIMGVRPVHSPRVVLLQFVLGGGGGSSSFLVRNEPFGTWEATGAGKGA
jgi:hypothetical protein